MTYRIDMRAARPATASEVGELRVTLLAAGFGYRVVRGGDVAPRLDNGLVAIELSNAGAVLTIPYGRPADGDELADAVLGTIGLIREDAGWPAFDPQLERELHPETDRAAFLMQFEYSAGVAGHDAPGGGEHPARSPWWRRLTGR